MPIPGQKPNFASHALIDTTPMPDGIPKVEEIGSTSAPLLSASYFIGARCRAYNDDYMQCKTEANGRGELECMKEGRKVTRCASSVLDDVTKNCLEEFRAHWKCLDDWNHQLWQCRRPERKLNACVFEKLGLEKTIPGAPEKEIPVHQRQVQIYANMAQHDPGHPDAPSGIRPFTPVLRWLAGGVEDVNKKRQEIVEKREADKAKGA